MQLVTNSRALSIVGNAIPRPPSSAIKCVMAPDLAPLLAASSRIATIQERASLN
jgi:hypothetical protein